MLTQTHPSGSLQAMAATRLRQADAFLHERGLTRASLAKLLNERFGMARYQLLTSSSVHGLANATSDIDFIRIQQPELSGARMAIQVFEQGQHIEAISYSVSEASRALAELDALAESPPAAVVAGYRAWDKANELRRKYLERLVNGIALDGNAPYLGHTPALARVWKWASLQTAVDQALFTVLAQSAGESRGRIGYALNVLLHLMDATLSHHQLVFSNRKWYLLRWQRFLDSAPELDTGSAALVAGIEALRGTLRDLLNDEAGGGDLASECLDLLGTAFTALGEGHQPALRLEPAEDRQCLGFLPGSWLVLDGPGTFLRAAPSPSAATVVLGQDPELPGNAGDLLRVARAGQLRLLPALIPRAAPPEPSQIEEDNDQP